MNEVRSELTRTRPRLVLTWAVLTGLFAVLINTVMFRTVGDGVALPADAPGVVFPSVAALAAPGGLVAGVAAASSLFGVVTLSFWAVVTAGDASTGLVRLLAAAQPRRWRLMAGKVAALTLWTAAMTTVAVVVNMLAAVPAARAAGVDTSRWGTDVVPTLAGAWANAFCALLVWGVIGLVLAVSTRSSAVAISAGVAYVLVVEALVRSLTGGSSWLPGSTLAAVAAGGTPDLSYGAALGAGAAYVVLGLTVGTTLFQRRDITE